MRIKQLFILFMTLCLCFYQASAEAAISFSAAKTGGATDVTMRDPPGTSVTYTISNAAGSEPIVQLAFKLPNVNISSGAFTWASATSLPAGWSVTKGMGTREITVQGPAINPGSSASFTFTLGALPTWTQDILNRLDRIRAKSAAGSKKDVKNLDLFTRHALRLVSMIAAPSLIAPGTSFTLVLTVRNESSAILNSIRSDPTPPTMTVLSGSITNPTRNQLPSAVPNPLSLGSGATGTITYTYATAAADNGSISFSITRLRHPATGGVTATSISPPPSNSIVIGGFVGVITVDTNCLYEGNDVTVTMTLTNYTAGNITNVTPTLTPGGTAVKTLQSGPSLVPPFTVPAGGSRSITWVYRITAFSVGVPPADSYSFNGTAVGSSTAVVIGWSGGKLGEYIIAPASTNAFSTKAAMTFSFVNDGCAATKIVSITLPAGWSWDGDAYSLIDQVPDPVELSSPPVADPVVFTATSVTEQLPLGYTGEYQLVLGTPTTTGASTFPVTITDANDQAVTVAPPPFIQVNAFGSGSPNLNKAGTDVWREEVR